MSIPVSLIAHHDVLIFSAPDLTEQRAHARNTLTLATPAPIRWSVQDPGEDISPQGCRGSRVPSLNGVRSRSPNWAVKPPSRSTVVSVAVRDPASRCRGMPANVLAQVKREVAAEVPLRRDATLVNVQVQAGAGGQPHLETETAPKFFSRDSTTAVTYRQAAIIVETTKYQRYERVRELVGLAVRARQAVSPIDGVDRIGLRYVNEVRAPSVDADGSPMGWGSWLDSSLLGPLQVADDLKLQPQQLQGFAQFEVTQDQSLALRFGPLDGYAVNPDADLKRTTTPPGPFFPPCGARWRRRTSSLRSASSVSHGATSPGSSVSASQPCRSGAAALACRATVADALPASWQPVT